MPSSTCAGIRASRAIYSVSSARRGESGLDPLNGPELHVGPEPRVDTRTGRRTEMLPPHANVHFPIVENFVDAILANDPGRLACPAEQAAWVDWTIEQVVSAHAKP